MGSRTAKYFVTSTVTSWPGIGATCKKIMHDPSEISSTDPPQVHRDLGRVREHGAQDAGRNQQTGNGGYGGSAQRLRNCLSQVDLGSEEGFFQRVDASLSSMVDPKQASNLKLFFTAYYFKLQFCYRSADPYMLSASPKLCEPSNKRRDLVPFAQERTMGASLTLHCTPSPSTRLLRTDG